VGGAAKGAGIVAARVETCYEPTMKTITVTDLRQHWPKMEATSRAEAELIVTRHGRPVAQLIHIKEQKPKRKLWDPEEHMRWLKKIWGNKMMPSSDEQLAAARADQKFDQPMIVPSKHSEPK
jgi:antitoxin (DNA-binding transcriptional repressor) of toxin-antitoxin stability system